MLTALDFPDELLYSRDAVWVRDDGAGSVRLGLNAFAHLGVGDADVYMVKLPKGGARLHRGQPFGHVDCGRRTIESLKSDLLKKEAFLQGLREALKMLPRLEGDTATEILRPGSEMAKARELVKPPGFRSVALLAVPDQSSA